MRKNVSIGKETSIAHSRTHQNETMIFILASLLNYTELYRLQQILWDMFAVGPIGKLDSVFIDCDTGHHCLFYRVECLNDLSFGTCWQGLVIPTLLQKRVVYDLDRPV